MSAQSEVEPSPFRARRDPSAIFEIFQNQLGRWYAKRADGMVLGIFFKREDAVRFARRECEGTAPPLLIVKGIVRTQSRVPRAA
jgi:hypothetical protein